MRNLIIYFILFFVCIVPSYFAVKQKKQNESRDILFPYLIIGITFFSIIVGLRWNVGKDYQNYFYLLNDIVYEWDIKRIEIIPRYLIYFFRDNHFPPFGWFILMAWFQLFFFARSFNNKLYYLLPLGIFFYLGIQFGASLNIIRQCVAYSIALWAYTFIPQRKPLFFGGIIALGFLFHKSIVITLPLYFISYKRILPNDVQILLVVLSYLLGEFIVSNLISNSDFLWQLVNYEHIQERIQENTMTIKAGSGVGIMLNYFRYFVIVRNSRALIRYYSCPLYTLLYNIFFIGVCLYGITGGDIYLSRAVCFFLYAEFFITPSFVYYAFKNCRSNLNYAFSYLMIIFQLIIVFYTAIVSEPWNFVISLI